MQDASKILKPVARSYSGEPEGVQSSIIPQSLQLGGLTINVRFDPNMASQKNKMIGFASYATQEIWIDPTAAPQQFTEQAYLHELTHWIFYMMNEDELRNNERLVDLFAHFLYQALSSAKFQSADLPMPRIAAVEQSCNKSCLETDDPFIPDDEGMFAHESPYEVDMQAMAEEEEQLHNALSDEMESWVEISEDYARSDDEGWFYED
jgi:hypothetical protein